MQRATRAGAASGAMKNFVYRATCNMVSGMKTLVQKVAGLRLKFAVQVVGAVVDRGLRGGGLAHDELAHLEGRHEHAEVQELVYIEEGDTVLEVHLVGRLSVRARSHVA